MNTPESILAAFTSGLDAAARVHVRRPGSLFQIELPAFLADGDVAPIYVRPVPGDGLQVTDLGTTRMRLSHVGPLSAEIEAMLGELAEAHGLAVEEREIRVVVPPQELVAATLGLLQVEAQAECLLGVSKAVSSANPKIAFRRADLAELERLIGACGPIDELTKVGLDARRKEVEADLFKAESLSVPDPPR